jgi:hypothetical protein
MGIFYPRYYIRALDIAKMDFSAFKNNGRV